MLRCPSAQSLRPRDAGWNSGPQGRHWLAKTCTTRRAHRRAEAFPPSPAYWLWALQRCADPLHDMLLPLGQLVHAPLQAFKPVSRPTTIFLRREHRRRPAHHRQRGTRRR
jgi:hypothetical protein